MILPYGSFDRQLLRTLVQHFPIPILFLLGCATAQAESLQSYVESALANNAELRSADAQREAAQEQRSQGIAQLLPQVSFQMSRNQNVTETMITGSGQTIPRENEYPSESKSLQLRQQIVRPRLVFNALQGGVKAEIGALQFETSRQAAISRVAKAYLDCLRQGENVGATRIEKEAAALRLRQSEGMREAGEVSDVELAATRSAALLASARQREAEAALADAQRELSDSTGMPTPPQGESIDWLRLGRRLMGRLDESLTPNEPGIESHPLVATRARTLESVKLEGRKAASDHAPTLDLVAGISESASIMDIAINRQTNTRFVGLQLAMPIFSGGMTQSLVREQASLYEKAQFDLDAARLRVTKDRARTRDAILTRREMLEAAILDAEAMRLLLLQAEKGLVAGIRSAVDQADASAKRQRSLAKVAETATNVMMALVEHQAAQGNLDLGLSSVWDAAMAASSVH